jgi:hypothetical protein
MKCKIISNNLECVPAHMPPGHEAQWAYRSVLRNRRMQDIPYWHLGAILEMPDCYMLVEQGCALPEDEECRIAAGMTPEMIRAAIKAYERLDLGIHPDDFADYDAGIMAGYNADGSKKPGPNFKAARPDVPLAEEDDEEDDK